MNYSDFNMDPRINNMIPYHNTFPLRVKNDNMEMMSSQSSADEKVSES